MFAGILCRGFFQPRHFRPHAAPGLVGAPHPGRQPGHAGFHQHDLQPRKLDEHAFGNQTVQHAGKSGRPRNVIFQIIRRPTEIGRRMPVRAAGVNPDRQIKLLGHAINRPVLAPAQRNLLHFPDQHLDEARIGRATFDLTCCEFGAVHRHDDRRAQPWIAIEPFLRHPIIDRPAERRRQIFTENRLGAMQNVTDRVPRAEPVQRLSAQRVEIATRDSLWPASSPAAH